MRSQRRGESKSLKVEGQFRICGSWTFDFQTAGKKIGRDKWSDRAGSARPQQAPQNGWASVDVAPIHCASVVGRNGRGARTRRGVRVYGVFSLRLHFHHRLAH